MADKIVIPLDLTDVDALRVLLLKFAEELAKQQKRLTELEAK